MIGDSSEKELPTKQEGCVNVDDRVSTSSRIWQGLRNPRIVRVSRALGGKDRHSKVSTIRGLRDRRVRLSVPTAIQLYDLQDRLGLNQPSKVVDWLLNAAQHEIDKLPPLQMPPGNFIQFPQSLAFPLEATPPQSPSHPHPAKNTGYRNEDGGRPLSLLSSESNSENLSNAVVAEDLAALPKSAYWVSDARQRSGQRETPRELGVEKGNIMKGTEVENQDADIHSAQQVQAHDSLIRATHSSLSALLSNSMPYTSYYHWEPSINAYASHMGIHSSQLEVPPPISSLLSNSQVPGSQLVLCPSGAIPSMFPPASTDFDARQFSHFQMENSASQNPPINPTRNLLSGSSTMRYFHSNLASKHQHSQQHHDG